MNIKPPGYDENNKYKNVFILACIEHKNYWLVNKFDYFYIILIPAAYTVELGGMEHFWSPQNCSLTPDVPYPYEVNWQIAHKK